MSRFKKHEVEKDGDWSEWVYPNRIKYKFACCDCGLVHDMQFDLLKRGLGKAIVFRARRNNRSTGQMRRAILRKAQEK
jgi:hypothetical protein